MSYFYENGSETDDEVLENDVEEEKDQEEGSNPPAPKKESKSKKEIEKKAKEKVKKKTEQAVAKNAGKMALKKALSHFLSYAFGILVIFIIVVGIIMFLVTMPGMVMEKLKQLFNAAGNYVAAFFGADTTEQISDSELYETLDYLEDMGYDLKGEGFLTGYLDEPADLTEAYADASFENWLTTALNAGKTFINIFLPKEKHLEKGEMVEDGSLYVDKSVGVIRKKDDDTIYKAESDFIFTYIMSDNYVYTLKNGNIATQQSADTILEKVTAGVGSALYKYYNFGFSWLFDWIGLSDAMGETWGKGMIALYYDGGTIGDKNQFVNSGTLTNWDSIKINVDTKKLSINRKTILDWDNNAIEFGLDGWTGRYGMPAEFLIAVHKATLMPDLAVDMVNSFPTEIELLLHPVSGEAIAGYKTTKDTYIDYATIQRAQTGLEGRNIFEKLVNTIDNWFETSGEVLKAQQLGVDVATGTGKCSCTFTTAYETPAGHLVYLHPNGNWYYEIDVYATGDADNEPVILHAKDTAYGKNGEVTVTDTQIVENACDYCREKLDGINKYLSNANDYALKSYAPYISRVKNHWYRDVYFVINKKSGSSNNVDGKKFVDYDYDYESVVKERWTLYETYSANSSDGYRYTTDPNKVGKFIYFEIDDDGKYKKDSSGNYVIFNGDVEDARPSVLYERKSIGGGKYVYQEYEGNYNNLEGKDLYRKNSYYIPEEDDPSEEYVKFTGYVAVSKKAVELKVNEENLEDLGWNENTTDVWTAYEKESTTSGFEPLFEAAQIEAEENETYKEVMKNCYINLNITGNIIQVGEGIRTETNPEIKKMFLVNNYLRYDGSRETAEIVTALREKIYEDRKAKSSKADKYGPITNEERETKITVKELKNGETVSTDYYAKDYSGKVMLSQDSLNAFSILENTHTLDADYIYRDFKELVVELGYFEKEELVTESPRKLLQFPVPEIGSGGYPNRAIDKRNNEFGTMIHSKYDIETNDAQSLMAVYLKAAEEVEAGIRDENIESGTVQEVKPNASATSGTVEIENTLSTSFSGLAQRVGTTANIARTVGAMGSDFKRIPESGDGYEYKVRNGNVEFTHYYQFTGSYAEKEFIWSGQTKTLHAAACGPTSCINLLTGYGHDVNPSDDIVGIRFDATISGVKAFMESYDVTGESYSGLSDSEYVTKIKEAFSQGRPIITLMTKDKTGDPFWTSGGHFVAMVGQDKNGNIITLDSGSSSADRHTYTGGVEGLMNCLVAVWIADEAPDGMNIGENYEGFLGNEAVVSPVTGVLLAYGTYTDEDIDTGSEHPNRVNVDLKYGTVSIADALEAFQNGETAPADEVKDETTTETEGEEITNPNSRIVSEKVGYAKILVLDKDSYEKLETFASTNWKNSNGSQGLLTKAGVYTDEINDEDELEDILNAATYPALTNSVYGYKEFAERYEMAGIAGYVITIDGFKTELPDEEFGAEEESEDGEEGTASADVLENKEKPQGKPLTIDSFKVSETDVGLEKENENIISLYEEPESYKLASEKATKKLAVEEKIKTETAPAIYVKDLIFIKEGTVIGRTYTDREVVEDLRGEKLEDYIVSTSEEETEEDGGSTENKLIGNYLKVSMLDTKKQHVEDVENYMKLDEMEPSTLGNIEQFMYWQAKEPEGFEYVIDGSQSYSYAKSNGKSRRDNPSDKYGHDYAIDDGGAGDRNLCPGMWMDPGSSAAKIFTKVTGQTSIEMLSTWCTGEQLLDIYTQELQVQIETLKNQYPKLADLEEDDTRLFALIDVMYAGSGNFTIGTIDDAINAGRELTKEDFLSNCTDENAFYRQNPEGFTRRRLCDWYMYSEGKFGVGVYDGSGKEITKRYEFTSETPFQDLMRDIEGAKIVDM